MINFKKMGVFFLLPTMLLTNFSFKNVSFADIQAKNLEGGNTAVITNDNYNKDFKNCPTVDIDTDEKLENKSRNTLPKISVIIPVYNTSPYLRECLDCVIGQTFSDIEIICVDDGSTDDSLKILKEYETKDKRVKVINNEHKGAAAARNAGLDIAKGDFIAFIDSDDTINLNTYEIAYKKAKDNDVDILMFGEDKLSIPDKVYANGFSALSLSGSMMLWNKLYKKEFLQENNFRIPENIACYHDETFNSVVLPKAKRIVCIKDKFYHYRRKRAMSIQTSSSFITKANSILKYADYVCKDWEENNYISKNGLWLFKKLLVMSRRVTGHLSREDLSTFCKSLKTSIEKYGLNSQNNLNSLYPSFKSALKMILES